MTGKVRDVWARTVLIMRTGHAEGTPVIVRFSQLREENGDYRDYVVLEGDAGQNSEDNERAEGFLLSLAQTLQQANFPCRLIGKSGHKPTQLLIPAAASAVREPRAESAGQSAEEAAQVSTPPR